MDELGTELESEAFLVCHEGKWFVENNVFRLFNNKDQAHRYKLSVIEKYDLAPSKMSVKKTAKADELIEVCASFKKKKPKMKVVFTSMKEDIIIHELVVIDAQPMLS